jgi:hypothetical protein
MLERSLAGLAALVLLGACGGGSSQSIFPTSPTAASIAVQPGDLPSGMQKCNMSGDIDSFLDKAKTKDPANYKQTQSDWDAAKKQGATSAYTAFYTDTAANCASLETSASDITSAPYKLVVNFVIQFKDEASASKGYANESIFGVSKSSLKGGAEGTATGLGPNSIVLSNSFGNQTYYVGAWQNKAFMVILVILNIDAATCKKAAVAVNSRIK